MKIDPRTIQILKNFATINQSLLFKKGSDLSTISPSKTILAHAQVHETFPHDFAIYDLSRFISVLSMFEDPSVDINDRFLLIKGMKQQAKYIFASPEMIVTPPDKIIILENPEITFNLNSNDFQTLMKAVAILQLPEIAVVGNGKTVLIMAVDTKNPTGDDFEQKVGETKHTFRMIFKAENFKMISDNYVVNISSKGIAHFKGCDVMYWLPCEQNSKFEE